MDPNEKLRRLRELVRKVQFNWDHVDRVTFEEGEFAKHFQALDDWIQAGGFLPEDWEEV